jgi:hypothetical protein
MKIIEPVSVEVVQAHEVETDSNARLCTYDMPIKLGEVKALRATLDANDLARLFLLGIGGFDVLTKDRTWRVADLLPTAWTIDRMKSFVGAKMDLRQRPDLAVVIATANAESGPLVLIDGNHRAMAHFLSHRTVEDLPAFVCEHDGFRQWPYVPPLASF